MKQRYLVGALGFAIVVAAGAVFAAPGQSSNDTDRVLVRFKPGGKAPVEKALKALGGHFHHAFDDINTFAVSLPVQAIDGLRHNPNVELIEIDTPRYPAGQTMPWGIPRVQAPETVAAGADGSGIKVCVIDSGINASHEEFAGVALTGDAADGQDWFTDSCGHGTHVAGTIAAADNDRGVVGVSPGKVDLHIVKVFDGPQCGWSYSSDLVAAVRKCEEAGAKVINMSLGGLYSNSMERDEFAHLYGEGILSIAAAGNDGNSNYEYPASYDTVVSVAALDHDNTHAPFSQYNPQVELAAPGVGVLSTTPFRNAALGVADDSYIADAMVGTLQGVAEGALVNGGQCLGSQAWSGKVVLCERGESSFVDKVDNVIAGGGAAAIVYNNQPGNFTGSLGGATSTIPALSISQEDGQSLIAARLGQSARVSTVFEGDVSAYGYKDGTSMATPHVAGVAALVWSADPTKSNEQVRVALGATALDVDAPGLDANTGWGLVQASAATTALLEGGPSEPPPTTPVYLAVEGGMGKGGRFVSTLSWTGGGDRVDILRNGRKVQENVANTGSASDALKTKGHGTLVYQVCNAGTGECSGQVTINY